MQESEIKYDEELLKNNELQLPETTKKRLMRSRMKNKQKDNFVSLDDIF